MSMFLKLHVAKVQRVNREGGVFSGSKTAAGKELAQRSQLNRIGFTLMHPASQARDHVEHAITQRIIALLCPRPNNDERRITQHGRRA